MNDYLNCYNRYIQKVAILQNAYDIEETQELNQIYHLNFSIPADDPKVEFLEPVCYLRWNDDGQLYRLKKRTLEYNENGEIYKIECEHVFASLVDNVMYGTHTYGGNSVKTPHVIEYILGYQSPQPFGNVGGSISMNWFLSDCEFERKFEYTWKNETLLNALTNIPKEFGENYMWDFDTTVRPWKLYLRKLSAEIQPEFYIRAERNLLGCSSDFDYSSIITRIYALGAEDENENPLTIESVNNGIPYIDAPREYIKKYGIIEYILIDQRFTNADTLKAYAQTILNTSLEPSVSRSFDVADLYPITNSQIDNARVGALAKFTYDNTLVFITKTTRMLDNPGNLTIEFSTRANTATDVITNLAESVRIQSSYT